MPRQAKYAIDEWRTGTWSQGVDEVKFTDETYQDDYKFHCKQLKKWDTLSSGADQSALVFRRQLLAQCL
jgi:hypothetical protein